MDGTAHVIRLEFLLDGQSPAGRASTPGNRERQFAGWLGLITAIDALATDDQDTSAATSPNQPTTRGHPR